MGEAKRKAAAKAKKDTGIIELPTGFKVLEETRDSIKKHDWDSGPRNRAEELTTEDCKRIEFSGLRVNRIMNRVELWFLGRLAEHISYDKCTPFEIAKMLERHTKIGVVIDTEVPDVPGTILRR